MTIGIYCIRQISTGRVYVGKSKSVEARFSSHRWSLKQAVRPKDCNRYLHAAVKRHGIDDFAFEILQVFDVIDEEVIAQSELEWMDFFGAHDRSTGFNLRRDSKTKMIVHPETRARLSKAHSGENNSNYGNRWTKKQRALMAEDLAARRAEGRYDNAYRLTSAKMTAMWKDQVLLAGMAQKIKLQKRKYKFDQYTRDGVFVRRWDTVEDIVTANPGYKWQNIYSVCNGYKPTYMGSVWKKVPRDKC